MPTVRSAALEEREDPAVGKLFSERYRIDALLGQGGFGKVYMATQLSMQRKVALKTLQPELAQDKTQLKRFYQEARAASAISSPHVVRVYDFGVDEDSGAPFIAMELLEGRTLSDVIVGEAPMEPQRAAGIARQVAEALSEAGKRGIVHRDLKPDNVFLEATETRRDLVRVVDFGIAKLTGDSGKGDRLTITGTTVGTPAYMSPEQVRGETVDIRSDLYALGCIFFELLTGRPPFEGDDRFALMMERINRPAPPPPDPLPSGQPLPKPLHRLHAALLSREVDLRPSSATPVLAILDAVEHGRRVDAAALIEASWSGGTQPFVAAEGAEAPLTKTESLLPSSRKPSGFEPTRRALPSGSGNAQSVSPSSETAGSFDGVSGLVPGPEDERPPVGVGVEPRHDSAAVAPTLERALDLDSGLEPSPHPGIDTIAAAAGMAPEAQTLLEDNPETKKSNRGAFPIVAVMLPVAALALAAMVILGEDEPEPAVELEGAAAPSPSQGRSEFSTTRKPMTPGQLVASDRGQASPAPATPLSAVAASDSGLARSGEGQAPSGGAGAVSEARTETDSGAAATAEADNGAASAPSEPEPAPTWARVRIDSTPPGARVMRGAVEICTTPCDEPMASSNEAVTLQVVHEGFRPASLELILPSGAELRRKVHLVKLKPTARPKRRTSPAPSRRLRTIRGKDAPDEKPARKLRRIRIDDEEAP